MAHSGGQDTTPVPGPDAAAVLMRAAVILREQSRRPNGITVNVLSRVLATVAGKIRGEESSSGLADEHVVREPGRPGHGEDH